MAFTFTPKNLLSREAKQVMRRLQDGWHTATFPEGTRLVHARVWNRSGFERLYVNVRLAHDPRWEEDATPLGWISLKDDSYEGSKWELANALNTIAGNPDWWKSSR